MKKLFIYLAVVFFVVFLISIIKFNSETTTSMNWTSVRLKFSIQSLLYLFLSTVFCLVYFVKKRFF
jgi:hypothetical protein